MLPLFFRLFGPRLLVSISKRLFSYRLPLDRPLVTGGALGLATEAVSLILLQWEEGVRHQTGGTDPMTYRLNSLAVNTEARGKSQNSSVSDIMYLLNLSLIHAFYLPTNGFMPLFVRAY